MNILVTLTYLDQHGRSCQWQEDSDAGNAADAICRAFDNMEAAGIDVDHLGTLSGTATPNNISGISAAMSLCIMPSTRRQ